jgi:hypothetical protein
VAAAMASVAAAMEGVAEAMEAEAATPVVTGAGDITTKFCRRSREIRATLAKLHWPRAACAPSG